MIGNIFFPSGGKKRKKTQRFRKNKEFFLQGRDNILRYELRHHKEIKEQSNYMSYFHPVAYHFYLGTVP